MADRLTRKLTAAAVLRGALRPKRLRRNPHLVEEDLSKREVAPPWAILSDFRKLKNPRK